MSREECAMELSLNEHPLPGDFSGGLSTGSLTWWFWVKAGMGFTIGAGIVTTFGAVLWMTVGMRLILRLLLPGF